MRETQEDIDTILEVTGEDLIFDSGIIKGVPMQEVHNLENLSSPYDIYKQEIYFWICERDFAALEIVEGMTFSYILLTKTFTFKIQSWLSDYLGFVELRVFIEGIE